LSKNAWKEASQSDRLNECPLKEDLLALIRHQPAALTVLRDHGKVVANTLEVACASDGGD